MKDKTLEKFLKEAKEKGLNPVVGPAPGVDGAEIEESKIVLCKPESKSSFKYARFVIPLLTRAEANKRDWRERSKRTQAAWDAVGKHVERWRLYDSGFIECDGYKIIRCKLTRLGGMKLDRTVNLPSALKAVEDAICYLIGIDDGNEARWQCSCEQRPGGPYGVEIELR